MPQFFKNSINNKMKIRLTVFFLCSAVFCSAIIYSPGKNLNMTKTELYFGMSKPGGGSVSSEEFTAFTDTVIAPLFYGGFSVIKADGAWLDAETGKTVFEESRIVVHYSEMNEKISAEIDTIRAKYKRYFNQQAVLRADQNASVNF
jgi:hypothetical protein